MNELSKFNPQDLAGIIALLLALGEALIVGLALVDVVRRRSTSFPAAGKQTKALWAVLIAFATLIVLYVLTSPMSPIGLLPIASVVVAGIYLADVKPAVRAVEGRGGGSGGGRGRGGGW